MSDRPSYVYLCFDSDDGVLYVGVTFDIESRANGHRRQSPWWPLVDHVDLGPAMGRRAALDLEQDLIDHHQPPHNHVGTRRWWSDCLEHSRRQRARHRVEAAFPPDYSAVSA